MVFPSLDGRRARRIAEVVKIDAVGNAGSCLEEGVHEVLERVLLSIRYLEGRQLLFFSLLAVHANQ